jgi:hypothetical protein
MADVDLRPLTIGEVLDRTFSLYKNHFWLFAGIMSVPYLILFLFQVGMAGLRFAPHAAARAGSAPGALNPAAMGGILAGMVGGALLFLVIYFAIHGAATAATVFAVSDLYLGRPTGVRQAFRRARGHVLRIIGVIVLTSLITVVGFLLLIVPGVILLCRMSVAIPAAMLEDASASRALERSKQLTKGFAFHAFLIFLIVWVMAWIGTAIFQFPFIFMALTAKSHVLPFGMVVLQQLSGFIVGVLVGPIGTIAFCLLYYNLRVRKEAFDLQHLMANLGTVPQPAMPAPGNASPA